jgi:putative ABC transport system ATP-binding protein
LVLAAEAGPLELAQEAVLEDNFMIECKDIKKVYVNGDVETKALNDISFTIKDGEFVAIMGPSGSGKSTLMHILGALDTPTSGKYYLDGEDVSKLTDDELADIRGRKIGFVFQSFNLLSRANVLRNVMLPLVYKGDDPEKREKKAAEALTSVGLEKSRWYHLSNQLSGGQVQRVAIARALVNDPTLIMADEPTGNLDSKTGDIVIGTFQHLHEKEGRTIILITHELDVAEHADRIIHVKDGEILSDKKNHNKRHANYIHPTNI